MRHYETDHAALLEVQVNASGEEQPGHVLVRGVPAARPDAVHVPALLLQGGAERVHRLVVVQPRRVADDNIYLAVRQCQGPYEVARVVRPDVVSTLVVQPLHRSDGFLESLPFGSVGHMVVVQREMWVVAALDVLGDVAHKRVEVLGSIHEPARKHELGVLLVLNLECYLVLCEQVAGAEP